MKIVSGKIIKMYVTPNDKIPFLEWLKKLKNRNVRSDILARIDRLKDGNYGDAKFVGFGIYELRIHLSPGYRIYFAYQGQEMVLLLLAGDKSSQVRDIAKAKEYFKDFKMREGL